MRKRKRRFTEQEYDQHYQLKKQAMERILGPMYPKVHAPIVPRFSFGEGGFVTMYFFPHALEKGTAFATMELIQPDGSGPVPSSEIGTYELVAFTKYEIENEAHRDAFEHIELRMRSIFSALGSYGQEAELNPLETVEVPEDDETYYVILDEYKKPGVEFVIGNSRHGLLLVIEVFPREVEYAWENGTEAVLSKLKERGYYPYSDLDREPVV